jgi:hypothetical protein
MKILLCLLMGTGQLFGQFDFAEVLGTVRDANPGTVAGAKITLRNLDTNIEREGSTNEQDAFLFPDIRAGRYSVLCGKPGFRSWTAANLELRTSERGQVVRGAQIRELPLNQRDYTEPVKFRRP